MTFSARSLKAKVRFLFSIAHTKYFQCMCKSRSYYRRIRELSRVKICILWYHKEHYEFSSQVFLKGSGRPRWKKLLALASHSQVLQFFNHTTITICGKQFTANIKKWVGNTVICQVCKDSEAGPNCRIWAGQNLGERPEQCYRQHCWNLQLDAQQKLK